MRYTGPKNRLARREGQDLFLKTNLKSDVSKQPGVRQKRIAQLSEYGKQLREKQKAKRIFGITERTCHRYFKEAVRRKGVTGFNFLTLLELRLDNAVYRAGFALTRAQARQMVNHKVFQVNGKRADIASFQVKPGDVITVRERHTDHPIFVEMKDVKTFPPKWMESNLRDRTIKIARHPEMDEMEQTISIHLIVEFYSR